MKAGVDTLKLYGSEPYFDILTKEEVRFCEVLRISPTFYLFIKDVFFTVKENHASFKRSETKKWFRLDVTKTGKSMLICELTNFFKCMIGSVASDGLMLPRLAEDAKCSNNESF